MISFLMVEEEIDNRKRVPNSNNTVELKEVNGVKRRTRKVHLNLQAEEARVLLDTN